MGVRNSGESASAITAKLILDDGSLQEFPHPVNVSHVLQKINFNSACNYFICNSDDMDFDSVVVAVSEDEELQPGQLYFALPLSRLRRRLRPEDMAALAVKASSALSNCGNVLEFSEENGLKAAGGRRRGGAGRRGTSSARLSAIPE